MRLLIICPTLSDNGLSASFRLIHLINSFLENKILVTVYLHDSEISQELEKHLNSNELDINIVKISKNNIFKKIVFRLFGIPDSMIFWGLKLCEKC
jgi:hypothetical protein